MNLVTVALGILKERFGNPQVVKDAHYQRLMSLHASAREIDEIEIHLRTLEALGEDMSHSYLITLIKSKIRRHVMEQIELSK